MYRTLAYNYAGLCVGCSLRTSEEANNNQGHGLLRISVPDHGLCRSQTAVSGLAECFGHCASGSSYSHGKLLKILICLCLYLYFGVLRVVYWCDSTLESMFWGGSLCFCHRCSSAKGVPGCPVKNRSRGQLEAGRHAKHLGVQAHCCTVLLGTTNPSNASQTS